MYRSANRPVRGLLATRRYRGFSPVSPDTRLYRAVTDVISTITARYRLVIIDFNLRRPLPGGISVVVVGCSEGRRGKRQEEEGGPQMVLPSNGEAAARLLETFAVREPRGGDFFVVIFSLSKVTKRGKRRRLLLTRASGEALATSYSRGEKKKRQRRPFSFLRDGEPWLSECNPLPPYIVVYSFFSPQ
ncbi:hypothetical protein BHM03_00019214 [Ensete ventricosum]|nr:hypothetical protein BHM03_00019214 [Ensete ventricosum]